MEKKDLFSIPNKEAVRIVRKGVKSKMAAAKAEGKPICGYDRAEEKAYIEFPDGKRIYG